MRKLLTGLAAGVVAGVLMVLFIDSYLSPGKTYFMSLSEQSDKWAEKLRSESDAPCYILEGSSDVRMSVDPATMQEEAGLRVINAALNAGNGENVNLVEALRFGRPGDTVVSFPLTFWSDPKVVNTGTFKFMFHRRGFGAWEPGLFEPPWSSLHALVKGNTSNLFMTLEKLVFGFKYGYKYMGTTTIHESGWAEVHTYPEHGILSIHPLQAERLVLKANIKQMPFAQKKCAEHGLSLVVQMPRSYADAGFRAENAFQALYLVRQGIPVLKDPALGVETDIENMADTYQHQNAQGARAYSRLLARLLAGKEYWTEAELVEELRSRGWNEDGTPMAPVPAEGGEGH